jgi:hypothetical protein
MATFLFIMITNWPWKLLGNNRWRQQQMPQEPQRRLHRRLWRGIKWTTTFVIPTLGLLGSIDYFVGRPWPVDPEIHPQNPIRESSSILPFTVRNRSFFPMKNVSFVCGVDFLLFEDADGKRGGMDSTAFFTGVFSVPRDPPLNYPCSALGAVQIRADGSLSVRDTLATPPGFRAPLKILKMCVWIGGDYRMMLKVWSFTSNIFTWPASQTNLQFLEGPEAVDQDRPKRLPTNDPDDLHCRPNVEGPYAFIKGNGPRPFFLPDILNRARSGLLP